MNVKEFRFTDEGDRTYIFYVKESFFKDHPKVTAKTKYELNNDYKLSTYLHNLEGPAVLLVDSNLVAYRINGKLFKNRDEWEKEVHKIKFSNKLEDLCDE
jgi:hypothetical protein